MGIAYLQKTAPSLGRLAFRKPVAAQPWLARRASVGGFAPCAGRQLRRVQSWLARGGIYRPAASRQYGGTQTNAKDFHANLRLSALTLCLAFVAGAAHAEGKTREQVRAELMEAKAAGLVTYGEQQYPVDVPDNAVKTRQQVLEERDAARAAGQITRGELDYPPVAREAAGKTREQVIAEMRQARAQGLMKSGELDYPPTGH